MESTQNEPVQTTSDADSGLAKVVDQLEAAWNAGDGDAFGAPFAENADFVNIRGEYISGRRAIAAGHAAIFASIYSGSTNRYTILSSRQLSSEIGLVHVRTELQVPHGPLAGKHSSLFSMVLRRTAGSWEIVAFHNTLQEH